MTAQVQKPARQVYVELSPPSSPNAAEATAPDAAAEANAPDAALHFTANYLCNELTETEVACTGKKLREPPWITPWVKPAMKLAKSTVSYTPPPVSYTPPPAHGGGPGDHGDDEAIGGAAVMEDAGKHRGGMAGGTCS